MKKIIVILFLTIAGILFSRNANAQEAWEITNFTSNIDIQENGLLLLTETIDVDFGTLQKHGIYRDIPYVYQEENGTKSYTNVELIKTTLNNQKVEAKTTQNNANLRLKIGDPDTTISGPQSYKITYTVEGGLLSFDDYDELYWNITGNDWEVPMQNVQVKVTLPKDSILQGACYQGYYGEKEKCHFENNKKSANFAASRPLATGEGLTVALGFEKGTVPIVRVARPKTFLEKIVSPASMVAFAVSLSFGILFVFFNWFKGGRDYWRKGKFLYDSTAKEEIKPIGGKETIVVEYDPPEDLKPAELGTLMDEKADTLDVSATIVDLAQRGFLKIVEVEKSWTFGKVDYKLEKQKKEAKGLLAFEKLLLEELFDSKEEVTLSSLKNKFYQDLALVKKELYKDVVDKKLFPSDPEKVRTKYLLIAIASVIISVAMLILGANLENGLVFDIGVGTLTSSVLMLLFARAMPRKTAYGRELYRRTKGYRLFLEKAEKHRQQFFERKNLFNQILPYAIVFGLTEKLAHAFKVMGLPAPQTNWYVGTHPFNTSTFGQSVNDFSNSLSSSISSAPSSSGSGGSGFSGGGGGGGGGGSW